VIEVSDLTYRYPDGTEAIRDVNINLDQGEFTALIGQNGSGKTTCAKCISGLFEPTEGSVEIKGTPTTEYNRSELAQHVGYVFQNPDHQLFTQSVRAEIETGPRNLGLADDEVDRSVREAAATAGVHEELFEEHPFFLTKGLRQRVAIASILAMRPETIIVDVPTTGQDHPQSLSVMDFLEELNEEHGHSVVIITHDIYIVARYADRLVLFSDGEKITDGPTRYVFSDPETLAEANVRPPQIIRFTRNTTGEVRLTVKETIESLDQ
jgi:energy-coupling factor transport system ATP-binding protein